MYLPIHLFLSLIHFICLFCGWAVRQRERLTREKSSFYINDIMLTPASLNGLNRSIPSGQTADSQNRVAYSVPAATDVKSGSAPAQRQPHISIDMTSVVPPSWEEYVNIVKKQQLVLPSFKKSLTWDDYVNISCNEAKLPQASFRTSPGKLQENYTYAFVVGRKLPRVKLLKTRPCHCPECCKKSRDMYIQAQIELRKYRKERASALLARNWEACEALAAAELIVNKVCKPRVKAELNLELGQLEISIPPPTPFTLQLENSFEGLPVEDCVEVDEDTVFDDDAEDTPRPQLRKKLSYFITPSSQMWSDEDLALRANPPAHSKLSWSREVVYQPQLVMVRSPKDLYYNVSIVEVTPPDLPIIVDGHMPDPEGPHGEPEVSAPDERDNVAVEVTSEESTVTIPGRASLIKRLCQSEAAQRYAAMANRWSVGAAIAWETTHDQGTELVKYKLPIDFVKEFKTQEQMLGFQYFAYWRGDIVFKITSSISEYASGMLQVAWFYGLDYDKYSDRRQGIDALPIKSTTHHCLLSAGSSNSCELRIPYKSYRPYVTTRVRAGFDEPVYLGELIISVLNPLRVPDNCVPNATIIPHMALENSEFMGMLDSSVAPLSTDGHMLTMLRAAKALYQEFADPNRDLPPNTMSPIILKPRPMNNFASGTNDVHYTAPLRLDPLGQTPHPSFAQDEMTIAHVSQVFGFVHSFQWTADQAAGTQLYCADASPCWDLKQYKTRVIDSVTTYCLPPIAVLSQMYAQWRGSIELRFDLVSTKHHFGKLLCAYIPFVQDNVSFKQAKGGICTEFSLSDNNRQFSMMIPYIADRPYWPRRYSPDPNSDQEGPPGRICIYVVAPLSITCTIPKIVDVNVYIRGGPDFELAVPIAPSIAPAWNVTNPKPAPEHTAHSRPGYVPLYAGVWRNFEDSKELILRWGTESDRIAQFDNFEMGYIYKVSTESTNAGYKDMVVKYGGGDKKLTDFYLVPVSVNDGYGFVYCALCSSQSQAYKYWCDFDTATQVWTPRGSWDKDHKVFTWTPNNDQCANADDTTKNTYGPELTLYLVGSQVPNFPTAGVEDDYEVVAHVNNEREASTTSIVNQPLGPSSGSKSQYGEFFGDLKDLCRRQQFLTTFKSYSEKDFGITNYQTAIPTSPLGLNLQIDTSKFFDLYSRYTLTALISSGYRFYRGGLRYCVLPAKPGDCSIRFRHRPESYPLSLDLVKLSVYTASWQTIRQARATKGHAECATHSKVNPSLECEVPYYQRGEYGLLQVPNFKGTEVDEFFSNGYLDLSISTEAGYVNSLLYYSIADDMRFSTFQGFPPMVMLKDYPGA